MEIIIINGSPRKNGLTATILHALEKRLVEKGANVNFYDLIDLDIKQCIGCCSCYKTGKCVFNDDAEKLSSEISNADGIVIGSPTYASNISGILKQLIDRGHFVIEQLLHNQYAITVATGENYGSKDTSKILNKLVSYSGAKISKKIVYNAAFNSKNIQEEKIKKAADKLFNDIKNKKNYPIQNLIHKIILKVGIIPLIKRKGTNYQGVVDKWKKKNIKL